MPRSKLAVSRGTKSLGSPWSDICHMLARNHIQYRSIEFPVSQSLRESNPQDPYALHLLRVLPVLWVAMTICTADLTLHHILSCAICIKGSQESSGPSEICHGWPRWWFHPIDKMPHDASMIWLDKLQFPQGGQQLRHFSTAPWPSMACITRVLGGSDTFSKRSLGHVPATSLLQSRHEAEHILQLIPAISYLLSEWVSWFGLSFSDLDMHDSVPIPKSIAQIKTQLRIPREMAFWWKIRQRANCLGQASVTLKPRGLKTAWTRASALFTPEIRKALDAWMHLASFGSSAIKVW